MVVWDVDNTPAFRARCWSLSKIEETQYGDIRDAAMSIENAACCNLPSKENTGVSRLVELRV